MREPDDLVIAGMAFQEDGGVRIDGLFVVLHARLVCRAHFFENRATLLDDVGQAERAADLDQFTSRCDDLSALRSSHQAEQDGSCTIVHNESSFRAGQLADETLNMRVTGAAPPCIQI